MLGLDNDLFRLHFAISKYDNHRIVIFLWLLYALMSFNFNLTTNFVAD